MEPFPPKISETFDANLDVLRQIDPVLGEKIARVVWPEDLKFIAALDGTTSAFSRQLSRSGWFACSGAPTVRERVICDRFTSDGSNVILPALGQGVGVKLLLNQLDPHLAVFVWDAEALNIALGLALHDFTNELKTRRLTFLANPDLSAGLKEYFNAHKDMALPTQMLSWPWIAENTMQEISVQLEQGVGELNEKMAQTCSDLYGRLTRLCESGLKERTVQVVSLSPSLRHHQLARDYQRALEKLGYRVSAFLLDRPSHNSGIRILKTLIESSPELIVSVGVAKQNWSIPVPASIRFVSVPASPGEALGGKVLEDSQPTDNEWIVLGSQQDVDALSSRVPAERLFAAELVVTPDVYRPLSKPSEVQVAVVADRPDPNPEPLGIRQQSHVFLWQNVREWIEKHPLDYSDDRIGDIVRNVSRSISVKLSDPDLFASFCELATRHLAPATAAKGVVDSLLRSKLRIRIYGQGWQTVADASDHVHPPGATSEAINEFLNCADVILFMDPSGTRRGMIYDALCAGRIVAVPRGVYQQLAVDPEILRGVVCLDKNIDAGKQMGKILQNPEGYRNRVSQARQTLGSKYAIGDMVKNILNRIYENSK